MDKGPFAAFDNWVIGHAETLFRVRAVATDDSRSIRHANPLFGVSAFATLQLGRIRDTLAIF